MYKYNRALFLDRDGVVNHDSGYTFKIKDFKFIDGIFDLCRAANDQGYYIVIVTNQSGIGRGLYTEQDFLTLTNWMREIFLSEGVCLSDVFYCSHHPIYGLGKYKSESYDRKPNPGMLLRAARRHNINLSLSIMVGDKKTDMEAGLAAGVNKLFLLNSCDSFDDALSINSLRDIVGFL